MPDGPSVRENFPSEREPTFEVWLRALIPHIHRRDVVVAHMRIANGRCAR